MSEQPITSLEDAVAALGALPMPTGVEAKEYAAALPWAALMDDEDLTEFLGDLLDALNSNPSCTREVLVEVEKTCSTWRLIAEAQHAHNTAPGPDALTRTFAPTQALRDVVVDGEHYALVHHDYRKGRDLPGGQR